MSKYVYEPAVVEPKWQQAWEESKAFAVPNDLHVLAEKPKFYVLDMFPYPSGAGIHVGHPEGYTATDVVARKRRMQGSWVLHPMGWDAFGLPAERAAVREDIHPAIITQRNVDNFRSQIKRLGFSYDWDREISTSAPDYYRFTQWIFLKLYERGLAYLADVPVWWCPAQGTVLANEEVKDGAYVDTGDPVERRTMKQWMLRITAYAEQLLDDLEEVDWPEHIKEMQRNWIGKSLGAEIEFAVVGSGEHRFTVFTTRPDTLFGATYCVLAPEHSLVTSITTAEQRAAVERYIDETRNKSELARTDLAREKTGVFTGAHADHPVTGEPIPIWIADYVLATYGTGAIMAVPGHDQRDHEFALRFSLPILEVIVGSERPIEDVAWVGDGRCINSGFLDGLIVEDAKQRMTVWLEQNGKGRGRIEYRLRDWLFSRQRYWGEPFPVLHVLNEEGEPTGEILPVPIEELPVELPPVDEYKPTVDGRPPLARAHDEWLIVELPDGRRARRETNTMPQWAGSCWYYLRYIDPRNDKEPWNRELEHYWMPVDLYIGGVEHAVLHLLYARFWHKVLYDCGLVSTKEPFQKLFNQGMILSHSFQNEQGKYFHPNDTVERNGEVFAKSTGERLNSRVEKMSKSKLNVVNPDDVIAEYGADALRLYELFMGPLEQVKPWSTKDVEGVYRFLQRCWRLAVDEATGGPNARLSDETGESEPELWKLLHKTIHKVSADIEALRMNTAISQMMVWTNAATATPTLPRTSLLTFVKLLSAFAPHLGEELWQRLGGEGLVCHAPWPTAVQALLVDDEVTIVVQVQGKKRDTLAVPRSADQAEIERIALASPSVQRHLEGKTPRKVIVVPGRLINLVV